MRILFLDQFSELGGAQRMLLDLLDAVRRRGWQAGVALPGTGPLCAAVGADVFPITCGVYSCGRKSAADFGRFAIETPRLARRLKALASEFRPDLVYINGPRLLPAAALARFDAPVLFHAHIGVAQGAARLLAGQALRRMKAGVVAVSQNVAESWQPFVSTPVSVIYNGVAGPTPKSFYPAVTGAAEYQRRRVSPGAWRVGCIGRIAPEKGQLDFLKVAARIHASHPDTHFVVVGSPLFSDQAAQAYDRRARKAAVGLPVEFTGWVDDVYTALDDLDLLLVPSQWDEPNPRVILEAFAAGVPVIAFARGGIPEVIQHGRTGFLCADAESMAAQAIELLQNGSRRRSEVSAAAHELWRSRFTREHWQEQMIGEIQRCAAVQCPASTAIVSA